MYMIWSTKNKPFRDCSLWYRGCYAIGWAIEGCPGKGILDNPHIYIYILHQTYATAPEFEHKHRVSGLGHLQPIRWLGAGGVMLTEVCVFICNGPADAANSLFIFF